MITAEKLDDKYIVLTSDYPMRDREQLRSIPGSKYNMKSHIWTAPLSWSSCVALRSMFQEDLVVGEKLTAWSVELFETKLKPAMEMRQAWDDPALNDIFPDLYPFQRSGVSFLTAVRRALLCDEMGTGKTPQTIRTLANIARLGDNPFPAIVVAPNNMTLTWKKEIERWWPGVQAAVIKGSVKQRRDIIADRSNHVLIINFEGVRGHTKLAGYGSIRLKRCYLCDPLMPNDRDHQPTRCEVHPKELNEIQWKTIVVDEAHRMKDPSTKQSRAIKALRTDFTENIFGLTGTAIADSPEDLWTILNLIDPREFPSRNEFIERYCLKYEDFWGTLKVLGLNPTTREEFFKIVDPKFRRMPKEAVLPFLPKKTYSRRYVEMSAKQAKAYKQMDDNQIAIIGEHDTAVTVAANPLTELTRLTQFSSAYAEINEEGEVRLAKPSNKLDALKEILDDTGDEPAVVFAQSRQLIELAAKDLKTAGISFSMIVGGQSPDEREEAKDAFQNGLVRVILCTIAAGGIGITLTRSNRCIFLQRSWSMIDNKQAEDRVHRIGSEIHDKIEIIDIISVGTVEESQHAALMGKEERLQEIMRDEETVRRVRELDEVDVNPTPVS